MVKTGTEFTYDNYHSIRSIDVFDIPVEDIVLINRDFKRYILTLKENNINTTIDFSQHASRHIGCEYVIILWCIYGLFLPFRNPLAINTTFISDLQTLFSVQLAPLQKQDFEC